jgi:type IV pilus assembly protein PilA
MKSKKGFTLVELLAVIVVLGIILVIAIPNVLGIIDNARKDSFAATAKMMASQAKTVAATNPMYVPSANGYGRIIPWAVLNLENVSKDVDNGSYDAGNSYVVVVKDTTGAMRYFVTLKGSARSVDRKEDNSITVDADTTVTATTVSATPVTDFGGVTGLSVTIEAAS